MKLKSNLVNYEDFGAVGDGLTDDLAAIKEAHAYANKHQLRVRTRPDATYHLGRRALTVGIATDTDWNTSRFTIDDTQVEDHKTPLFELRSELTPEPLLINRLTRDQQQLDTKPGNDCHVLVENDARKQYIRRGSNQNNGVPQQDCFILRRDGSIEGAIDWNYDRFSRLEARPIDDQPLILRGGIFTTFANQMKQAIGYNYWARNILITRSNTTIDGLTHYVVGETATGHPYRGFLDIRQCADIMLRNCFATGHKIYSTIGAAGKPVNMGSYDYHANSVVNLSIINCRMNHINDRTRWGVIATNFCKNILLEDCTLSRMDTHMGVSGSYTIRRCTLGWQGLRAIGRGRLAVEDSTLYSDSLISFRSDYGSTWEGDLLIRNCHWLPSHGDNRPLYLINLANDGRHDFGYACSMPREIEIDSLFVDDTNHPDNYRGIYFFADPDNGPGDLVEACQPAGERPFPYARCQRLKIRGITTASRIKPRISPNSELEKALS